MGRSGKRKKTAKKSYAKKPSLTPAELALKAVHKNDPSLAKRDHSKIEDKQIIETEKVNENPEEQKIPDTAKKIIPKKVLKKRLIGKPKSNLSHNNISFFIGSFLKHILKYCFLLLLFLSFLLAGFGGGLLYGYMATAHDLTLQDIRSKNAVTHIYDDKGQEIASLTGYQNINREFITINAVKPTYLDEAFIAIEDERFDQHIGIDLKRIVSAVINVLSNSGAPKHGGSTITQQTVKLITGNNQISTQRKIQEWYNAIRLERIKSKDEIMEIYVNLVPMGNSYVGVQSAAKAYFDKDISKLSIAECAFLAGIPNRPSTYDPQTENGKRNALRRMRIVLKKMFELELITENQYLTALDTELIFRQTPQKIKPNQINSYFVDYVIEQVIQDLISIRGYTKDFANYTVYNNGLKIYTTLNQDVQNKADEVYQDEANFIKNPRSLPDIPEKPQSSITILSNTEPGQIKALVGGTGKKTANLVLNRATKGYRSPGSSIKPVLVYAPAMQEGIISPNTYFTDAPKYLDAQNPKKPWPKNAGGGFSGTVTVRQALYRSINTIAVEIFSKMTPEIGLEYLAQTGIDRRDEPFLATSLGAFTIGVTTYEMAGAFGALANGGLYTEPHVYTKVLDFDNAILIEKNPEQAQVYSAEVSYVMTNILQEVLSGYGTGGRAHLKKFPAAGKTGTSEKDVDKWFCGYTPEYTATVWYGFDNKDGRKTSVPYSEQANAQLIWKAVMDAIHEDLEVTTFKKPSGKLKEVINKDVEKEKDENEENPDSNGPGSQGPDDSYQPGPDDYYHPNPDDNAGPDYIGPGA